MNLPKDTTMLTMDSPIFAEDFAAAIGLQPGEQVEFVTPQFERTDGNQVPLPDFSRDDWDKFSERDEATLKALGMGIWDKDKNQIHWLYPKEWYSIIPNGLMVTDINGKQEPFIKGQTDDDYRFGCLSFGFVQKRVKGLLR